MDIHTTSSTNYYKKDIYKYFISENVYRYEYSNFNEYRVYINNSINNSANKSYYLILDTTFSTAFFHWFAECAIYLPLFKLLKQEYSSIKIVFRKPRDYHYMILEYLEIPRDDLVYSIDNQNNVCFFPFPNTSLNIKNIDDNYKECAIKFINEINQKTKSNNKEIDYLIMPRQSKQNSELHGHNRINDCHDIIQKLNCQVLNTDDNNNFNDQINLVSKTRTLILSDGSSFLFNSLLTFGAKIIVLGDIVVSQINEFDKMRFYYDIIKSNNEVIFIPYLHGNFDNNVFLYSDIEKYIKKEYYNDNFSIIIPSRGSGDSYELFIKYGLKLYQKYLEKKYLCEFIIIVPKNNIHQVKRDIETLNLNLNIIIYEDESIISDEYLNAIPWFRQQIIKINICKFIKSKYYFILDDDIFLNQPLNFKDFFNSDGKINYSYEGWSDNSPAFQNHNIWLTSSANLIGIDVEYLKKQTNIMGVTPQLFITDIVEEMINYMGNGWESKMINTIATEFATYWCYLIKTNRTDLYYPNNIFYIVDDDIHLINGGYDRNNILLRINNGFNLKKNFFVVLQSHIKYPKNILEEGLINEIQKL